MMTSSESHMALVTRLIFCERSSFIWALLVQNLWRWGRGYVHYGSRNILARKHFFKTNHGAFRSDRTINLLILRVWTLHSTIIGCFQFLVQNKLLASFSCHFFYNALQNPLFTVNYYEFVLKINERHSKDLLLLLVTFH